MLPCSAASTIGRMAQTGLTTPAHFTGFAGQAWRRSKNGTHVRIAVVPQYPRTPGIAISQPLPGDGAQEKSASSAPVPPHFTSPPQLTCRRAPSFFYRFRVPAKPGTPPESFPSENRLRRILQPGALATATKKTTSSDRLLPFRHRLLSGMLSITAAIAVGIVIANNNAFKLKVDEADSTDATPASISAPAALSSSRPDRGAAPMYRSSRPMPLLCLPWTQQQPPKPNRSATARDTHSDPRSRRQRSRNRNRKPSHRCRLPPYSRKSLRRRKAAARTVNIQHSMSPARNREQHLRRCEGVSFFSANCTYYGKTWHGLCKLFEITGLAAARKMQMGSM